jgi:hypothetical protein
MAFVSEFKDSIATLLKASGPKPLRSQLRAVS